MLARSDALYKTARSKTLYEVRSKAPLEACKLRGSLRG